jgi:type VI secretion system protein ImpL
MITLIVALVIGASSLVVAWLVIRRVRAERAARALEGALAAQAEALERRTRPDRQPALRALARDFEQALATLRDSKLGHGRGSALHALPWYVIIGPPGAGKSTAIRGSGLSFPLAGENAGVRGIGGTRHCDWFLTNEAILLDTAGRYATGDEDRDEWQSFLDLLRRSRPRRPLDGVVLALSATELGGLDAAALAELTDRLRSRLDELMARLELRLPVYVLLTKCDLIPGFVESFADLRDAERGQLLGFTMQASDASLHADLERHWMRLSQSLERRAVMQLGKLEGLRARHAAYEFPLRVEQLAPRVTQLLISLFAENVYRDAPILRGVYLTSGTQQTADRKSYFLSALFRSVMFPDRGLVVQGARAQRRGARLRMASAAGVLLLALVIAFASARAFAANRRLLHEARRELTLASSAERGDALTGLAPLRARLQALQDAAREGTASELGLDQRPHLLPPLRVAYTVALREVLLQPLVSELARQLEASVEPALFDHTKAYLLLTQPKAAGEPKLDASLQRWLQAQLLASWTAAQREPVSSAQREELSAHLGFYLGLLADDPGLAFSRAEQPLRSARATLGRVPPVSLAIERIVEAVAPLGLDLQLEQLVGSTVSPWRARARVRGAFTRRGWESYVRTLLQGESEQLVGEAWVVEVQREPRGVALSCALRASYFARYVEEWRGFLDSLRMEEPSDAEHALAVLQDLTRGQPAPVERLMRSVAENARLEASTPALEVEAEGVLDQLRKKVAGSAKAALGKDPCGSAESVRGALEGFYGFGASSEPPAAGAPPPVTSAQIYQEQLAYLRDAMQATRDDPAQGEALLARASNVRTRVRSLIEAQPIGWRPRFEHLLWPAVQGTSASATSALAGEQARGWCSAVVAPHARTLRGRYPFAARGQDVALTDLADFYRPLTGTLWSYYAGVLQRDLPQAGASFEPRVGSGVAAHYTPELVRFLHRAHALSQALFPPRAEAPRVDLEVRVRPAPGIAQVLLTVDGQTVDFHNGPERWVQVTWPGASERRGASLRVRGDGIDELVAQDGEWGLVRLLEQGEVSAAPGERFFSARWRLHTQHDVLIDVRPARSENPLIGARGFLELFRGPGVEVPRALTREARGCRE